MSAPLRPLRVAPRARRLLVLAAALGAVLGGACAIPLGRGPDAPELDSRRVVGKREPYTLHAEDGSWCTVPPGRYKDVAIGGYTRCVWVRNAGGRQAVPLGR